MAMTPALEKALVELVKEITTLVKTLRTVAESERDKR